MMESPPFGHRPTVCVIDDDPAVRRALQTVVEGMKLHVQAYASGREFLERCDRDRPGCILVDVRLPGMSGLELLDRLSDHDIHLPVIIISAHGDVPMVVQAMKAGARNFLEKPWREQQLGEAIREALDWDAENRRRRHRQSALRRRLKRLTAGEREVLDLLVGGMSNKQIAARLELSVRTIEVRRAKLMQKMKASCLADLVRMAVSVDPEVGRSQAVVAEDEL